MPGRLMAQHIESSVRSTLEPPSKAPPAKHSSSPIANGITYPNSPPSLDAPVADSSQPPTNGNTYAQSDVLNLRGGSPEEAREPPPEIEHITQGFQPLSKLFNRAAQECFNDLNDLISNLAELADPPQVNGVVASSASGNTSPTNVRRRLQWLAFANTQREKFIKLLVVLQWSKKVDQVSKLIDLQVWEHTQELQYRAVGDSMGELVRSLSTSKVRAPDIEIALEALTTGKSQLLPDFGYIPPPQLTPRKLLRSLQNINVSLQIRFNLHEDLPKHFRDYKISSGRATFTVPTEFEVDLSIADEDPNSQLYFIDLRFLFATASEIPQGSLFGQLEGQVNHVLKQQGLSGCYEFLHGLVLTHKLNLLRRKAVDMSRTTWSGSLRVEQVHRSLIIQYWSNRPGTRSWVEIGVSSGKHGRRKEQSHLDLRWMRIGKEVADANISLDVTSLDLDDLLNQIISRHISYNLTSVDEQTKNTRLLTTSLRTSTSKPNRCVLQFPLLPKPAELRIEPISGQFVLKPLTALSRSCTATLNKTPAPAPNACAILQHSFARETSLLMQSIAEKAQWAEVTNPIDQHHLSQWFAGPKTVVKLFRHPKWPLIFRWLLAAETRGEEQIWSVIEVWHSPTGARITRQYRLPNLRNSSPSYIGAAFITQYISIRRISDALVSYSVLHRMDDMGTFNRQRIWVKPSQLLSSPTFRSIPLSWNRKEIVIDAKATALENDVLVMYQIECTLLPTSSLFKILQEAPIDNVSIDVYGRLQMSMVSTLDNNQFPDMLRKRLLSIGRLDFLVKILQEWKWEFRDLSLDGLSFLYRLSTDPTTKQYEAQVYNLGDEFVCLRFPSSFNPQSVLRMLLENLLNEILTSTILDLRPFLRAIQFTLPVCEAMTTISEPFDLSNPAQPCVHIHDMCQWILLYPRYKKSFSVQLKHNQITSKQKNIYWCIDHLPQTRNDVSGNTKLDTELRAFFDMPGKHSGQAGARRRLLLSPVTSVESDLLRLHKIFQDPEIVALAEPFQHYTITWVNTDTAVANAGKQQHSQAALLAKQPRAAIVLPRSAIQPPPIPASASPVPPKPPAPTSAPTSNPTKAAPTKSTSTPQQQQAQQQKQQTSTDTPTNAPKMQKQASQQGSNKSQQSNSNGNATGSGSSASTSSSASTGGSVSKRNGKDVPVVVLDF